MALIMWETRSMRVMESKLCKSEHGATMVESAIVLTVFLGVLFFTLSFCGQMYQYFRVANALRIAGRLAAIEASPPGAVPSVISDCEELVRTRFEENLGNVGLATPPELVVSVEEAGVVHGLRVQVSADVGSYFSPIHLLPTHISRDSFFPLENQNACAPPEDEDPCPTADLE